MTKEIVMRYLFILSYVILISLAIITLFDIEIEINNIQLVFLLIFSVTIVYMSLIKHQLEFNLKTIIELFLFVGLFLLLLLVQFDYSWLVFFVAMVINFLVFRRLNTSSTNFN